jgi:hypothetical protein
MLVEPSLLGCGLSQGSKRSKLRSTKAEAENGASSALREKPGSCRAELARLRFVARMPAEKAPLYAKSPALVEPSLPGCGLSQGSKRSKLRSTKAEAENGASSALREKPGSCSAKRARLRFVARIQAEQAPLYAKSPALVEPSLLGCGLSQGSKRSKLRSTKAEAENGASSALRASRLISHSRPCWTTSSPFGSQGTGPLPSQGRRNLVLSLPIPYSLFPIPYSLFPIPYSLFPIPYSLFPIPYSLFPIPYSRKSGLSSRAGMGDPF